ncbi:MAG: 16S rRNA (cytosine(1402)-N(4))-methyltransferase RsmH [bacterium]
MSDRTLQHEPVMTAELLEVMDLQQSNTVIDATAGFGGHARAVLDVLGPDGRLIGFERDPEVFTEAKERLQDPRVHLVNSNYRRMAESLPDDVDNVDAVYFDLGVSSYHLDSARRGFSFRRGHDPLDCRFNPEEGGATAAERLNSADPDTLRRLFRDHGEVRNLEAVVGSVLEARPMQTVGELRDAVEMAVPYGSQNGELARVFQALRISVNDELEGLSEGLEVGLSLLAPGGTLAAISYHSLEDRCVKQFLRREAEECICPPDLPVCACDKVKRCKVDDRSPLTPTEEEVEDNPRARSAKLRAATAVDDKYTRDIVLNNPPVKCWPVIRTVCNFCLSQ